MKKTSLFPYGNSRTDKSGRKREESGRKSREGTTEVGGTGLEVCVGFILGGPLRRYSKSFSTGEMLNVLADIPFSARMMRLMIHSRFREARGLPSVRPAQNRPRVTRDEASDKRRHNHQNSSLHTAHCRLPTTIDHATTLMHPLGADSFVVGSCLSSSSSLF
jgi:hypothetical protein